MRRSLALLLFLAASAALAQGKQAPSLSKKTSTDVDASLAGDITRKKQETSGAPLQYDQFRLGIELQVADKRREQIESLKKIIELSADQKEQPSLLFRLAELYWEESRYYFFEANRKDDDFIRALAAKDKAAEAKARAQKEQLSPSATSTPRRPSTPTPRSSRSTKTTSAPTRCSTSSATT